MRSALPIRWRLALLITSVTALVLVAFAIVVGTMTAAQLRSDFEKSVDETAAYLADRIQPEIEKTSDGDTRFVRIPAFSVRAFARGSGGVILVVTKQGEVLAQTKRGVSLGAREPGRRQVGDLLVDTRELTADNAEINQQPILVQFARSTDELEETIGQIWLLLILASVVGTALALAASFRIGARALRPVSELTATANSIAQTGDGSKRLPVPRRRDELAELALTLDAMLDSLDAARTTTERTLQAQRDFVADASHELRTPLTSIITNLEMLEDSGDPDTEETAEAALRSARRMRGLVADLLALARADAADGRRHAPIDLSSVVMDAIAETEELLEGHDVDVDLQPVRVSGDRDDLQRVVRNLLENAARHTPDGTQIKLQTGLRGGHASLLVEDNGPGVPAAVRGRAFERFVRSGTRNGASSGLGLSIVRATAQAHGGWVELRSPAALGRGTRVEVRLPPLD